jgi:hypothetical protein
MSIFVAKADGTTEVFDPAKLLGRLSVLVPAENVAKDIERDIEKEMWNGMTTQEIYTRALNVCANIVTQSAARYSLKRAVLDFGPSGFPFEAYLGELFRAEGYTLR